MLAVAFTSLLALPARPPVHRRQLSQVDILYYEPGSQVTDHANIDLDQAALVSALSLDDFTTAEAIYTDGAHSKPAATCTLITPATLGQAVEKKATVSFTTVAGLAITGKTASSYGTDATEVAFTYPVSESRVQPLDTQCYVGGLKPADHSTEGCIAEDGSQQSTFQIGATSYTASCTNSGKRTLQGFSTKAEAYMWNCNPAVDPNATYRVGCPYTSYAPYYEYYGQFDYANQIVLAALHSEATMGFTNGGMNFTGIDADARVEVIQKGTAYMNAWMYAIREFEDAIDDCSVGDITANSLSSGPVHAWDEGVAFYVGSSMKVSDLMVDQLPVLDDKGYLAYTLGSKRCQNFKTCGPDGDELVGEAKINIDLWKLFEQGKNQLTLYGNCGAIPPIKDRIVSRMTVPLVQGTLRYAFKRSTGNMSPKTKGEGALFAAAVLPQLHNCSVDSAKIVYDEMNMNSDDSVDFNAVKAAFEGCYESMDITCADVGGLWDKSASPAGYYMVEVGGVMQDATPCGSPPPQPEPPTWQESARSAGWRPCKTATAAARRRMDEERASLSTHKPIPEGQSTDDDN